MAVKLRAWDRIADEFFYFDSEALACTDGGNNISGYNSANKGCYANYSDLEKVEVLGMHRAVENKNNEAGAKTITFNLGNKEVARITINEHGQFMNGQLDIVEEFLGLLKAGAWKA